MKILHDGGNNWRLATLGFLVARDTQGGRVM